MRALLLCALTLVPLLAADEARGCPPPRPTATRLSLVSSADVAVAADGALLIQRSQIETDGGFGRDESWTLQTTDGKPVAVEAEELGGDLERWRIVDDRERDLQLVDGNGKVVQTLHQRHGAEGRLAGPELRRLTSTTARSRGTRMDVIPGAEVKVILAGPAPAGALFLTIATAGRDSTPLLALPVTAGQRTFELVSYDRKGCSPGDPTLLIGDHLQLTWLDAHGRRSAATKVTVARGTPSPPPRD